MSRQASAAKGLAAPALQYGGHALAATNLCAPSQRKYAWLHQCFGDTHSGEGKSLGAHADRLCFSGDDSGNDFSSGRQRVCGLPGGSLLQCRKEPGSRVGLGTKGRSASGFSPFVPELPSQPAWASKMRPACEKQGGRPRAASSSSFRALHYSRSCLFCQGLMNVEGFCGQKVLTGKSAFSTTAACCRNADHSEEAGGAQDEFARRKIDPWDARIDFRVRREGSMQAEERSGGNVRRHDLNRSDSTQERAVPLGANLEHRSSKKMFVEPDLDTLAQSLIESAHTMSGEDIALACEALAKASRNEGGKRRGALQSKHVSHAIEILGNCATDSQSIIAVVRAHAALGMRCGDEIKRRLCGFVGVLKPEVAASVLFACGKLGLGADKDLMVSLAGRVAAVAQDLKAFEVCLFLLACAVIFHLIFRFCG